MCVKLFLVIWTAARLVLREVEFKGGGFKDADDALVEIAELACLVVRWGNVPVEVVLVERLYHLRIGNERDPRGVEGGKVLRREVPIEGAFLADGENELDEREVERRVRAALRLRPHDGLGVTQREVGCGDRRAEIDLPENARAVERAEPVGGDPVLQLLLQDGGRIEDVWRRTRSSACRRALHLLSFVTAVAGRPPYHCGIVCRHEGDGWENVRDYKKCVPRRSPSSEALACPYMKEMTRARKTV